MASVAGLLRLMQVNTSGGSAETDDTALTVIPKRPAAPSVVTTDTPVTAMRMAAKKVSLARAEFMPAPHLKKVKITVFQLQEK
jgi:hypothetical protein